LLMGFNLGIIMRALFGIGSSRSLQTGGPLREVLATALQMRIPVFSTACAAPQSARNALGAILRSLRYFCIHSTAPTGKLPQEHSPIAA
ncbi:hypothetical protein JXA32_05240, partial [Candidatus Sumerlaeota bacterium]|nr:hypothetical protein [Candidatus Sumerlaeota bacterium]